MKKVTVMVPEVHYASFQMNIPENFSKEDILELVEREYESGVDLNLEFSHSLEREMWEIRLSVRKGDEG